MPSTHLAEEIHEPSPLSIKTSLLMGRRDSPTRQNTGLPQKSHRGHTENNSDVFVHPHTLEGQCNNTQEEQELWRPAAWIQIPLLSCYPAV